MESPCTCFGSHVLRPVVVVVVVVVVVCVATILITAEETSTLYVLQRYNEDFLSQFRSIYPHVHIFYMKKKHI